MKKYGCTQILSLLLTTMLLSSCGNTDVVETSDTTEIISSTETETVVETETEKILPNLPTADFDGYVFTIIDRGNFNSSWTSVDIYAEELNGEPINDAVYNRNVYVESTYNITVAEAFGNSGYPVAEIAQAVQAGDEVYDLAVIGASSQAELALKGALVDLIGFPHLDLSKPWYDQSANKAVSIAGHLFTTTGEITIMDNDATWLLLFNKELASNLGVTATTLYDMVLDGTWTLDALKEIITDASADLNGDGIHNEFDQWGIQGENFNTMAFMHGAGASPYGKDENDIPIITAQDEHFYDAFQKAIAINGNFDLCLLADNYLNQYDNVWGDVMNISFTEGRVLFACCAAARISLSREMEMDFGVLPIPKYDEAQETYHCLLSLANANMFSVPKTVSDQNRTGIITEAMSAESLYTLTPAYYDVTMKSKHTRDEQSSVMLDLIFAARAFDLGNMYPGLSSLFYVPCDLTTKGSTDLVSAIAAKIQTAQSGIDALVEALNES